MARMIREQQVTFARGMNDTAAPTEYRPDECETLLNGRISFDGQAIRRRAGSLKLHTSALNGGEQCYGGIEYYTAGGTQQLVVFVGNKMYTSTNEGLTWTEQATGLTTDYWSLVIMREGAANVLCCANGGTNSHQWDGTTFSTIANIPDNVKYLSVFGNRLWATGHNGIEVVASKVGNIDVYATPDGLSIQAQTHDGDVDVTGIYQLGSILLVFKSESMGYIEGYGFNTLEVETGARGISRSVGCIAHRTIVAAGSQGVMWLSKRGIEHYELGGAITLVTRSIQGFMDEVNWDTIEGARGIPTALWWPERHEYWCALPVGSTRNDNVVKVRPPHIDQPIAVMIDRHAASDDDTLFVDSDGYLERSSTSDRDQGDVLAGYLILQSTGGQWMQLDANGYLDFAAALHDHAALFLADIASDSLATTPISGGYDGFVRQLERGDTDNATSSAAGSAVLLKILTRPFLFGDQISRKRGRQIRVACKQDEPATITVRSVVDGIGQATHSLAYPASRKPISKKVRVGGRGYAHAVEITSTDDVAISVAELSAEQLRDAGR